MNTVKSFVTLVFRFSGSSQGRMDEQIEASDSFERGSKDLIHSFDDDDKRKTSSNISSTSSSASFASISSSSSSSSFAFFDHTDPRFKRINIETVLYITSFVPVQLEVEDQLYPCILFYGYFKRDESRKLHLIFSSFYFETDSVNLKSIPFKRVQNIIFEEPMLINSKYLGDCRRLNTLINVKINQKTLAALCHHSSSSLTEIDFRIYNLLNSTLRELNKFESLRNLKINFRKKVYNRKEIDFKLSGLENIELLEYWNTSSFQFITLPSPLFSLFETVGNKLKSLCLVRIRFKPKYLHLLLKNCRNLIEFEFLGSLVDKHFEVFQNYAPPSLSIVNLSGCTLEDQFVKMFGILSLKTLNLSHVKINETVLEFVNFDSKAQIEELNLSGIKKVPLSLVRKLRKLSTLKWLIVEKCQLEQDHLDYLKMNSKEYTQTLKVVVEKREVQPEMIDFMEKTNREKGKIHFKSVSFSM